MNGTGGLVPGLPNSGQLIWPAFSGTMCKSRGNNSVRRGLPCSYFTRLETPAKTDHGAKTWLNQLSAAAIEVVGLSDNWSAYYRPRNPTGAGREP